MVKLDRFDFLWSNILVRCAHKFRSIVFDKLG